MESGSTPEERATNAGKAFMHAVNEIGFDTESFVKVVTKDHRTLQQSAVGIAFAIITEMAKKEDWEVDPRNAQAVDMCKKVAKQFGDSITFPHI
jgi:hypothetical protein